MAPEKINQNQAVKDANVKRLAATKAPVSNPVTPLKASPLEQNETFKKGTNLTGSIATLADGTQHTLQGASSGQPAAQPEQPTPVTPAPEQPVTPATTVETPEQPETPDLTSALDDQALLAAGISQEQLDRMKLILNPKLAGNDQLLENADAEKEQLLKSLEDEQLMVEETYDQIAETKKNLAGQAQAVVDDSAAVQKNTAEQQRQRELFENSQAQKKYENEQAQNLREVQKGQRDLEMKTANSMAASLGSAFSFNGMMRMAELEQSGVDMISDLKSDTAYGMAEFSFQTQDIERFYTNTINDIEVKRRDKNVEILANLGDDLMAIDEKVLLSAKEKAALGRETISAYFDTKNEVDEEAANLISTANELLFTEADKIKKDKEEREMADLELSAAYGYFVNKYGQPVNTDGNGAPKPYVGDYNEDMSKQFGYLVNNNGQPILDSKGQRINWKDPEAVALQNAISAYKNGTMNEGDASTLNFKIGTNNVIASSLKNGQYYAGKYGDLQCGEYINDQFLKNRALGDDFANADTLIASNGGKPGVFQPQVGDVVFMDLGYVAPDGRKIPHKAIVEGMDEDGNMTFTDANAVKKGVVRHGWKINIGDANYKKIYGYARLPLKDEVALGTPMMTASAGTDGGKIALAAKLAETGMSDELIQALLGGTDSGVEPSSSGFAGLLQTLEGFDATEGQRTKAGFAYNALETEKAFQAYEDQDINPASLKTARAQIESTGNANFLEDAAGVKVIPMESIIANLKSPQEADVAAARLNWIKNVLRPESGAAIGLDEYQMFEKMYFPTETSTDTQRQNAKLRREDAIGGLLIGAGPLARPVMDYVGNSENKWGVETETDLPAQKELDSAMGNFANQASNGLLGLFNQATTAMQSNSGGGINDWAADYE
jgi:hypothetical protein